MAPSDPEHPSAIEAVLTQEFGEPVTPTLTRAEVLERIKHLLAERAIPYQRIDISDVPVHRNALSDAAGRRVRFPEGRAYSRCFVALIDPDTDARWAHPAWWAFVPADGRAPVEVRETRLPEHPRGAVRLYAVE
jgi:hypothetical protein